MNLHITGFGPFPGVEVNPSASVARGLADRFGLAWTELPVVCSAVDAFLVEVQADGLLMLGVDIKADRLRLETVGQNRLDARMDAEGRPVGPGLIDPKAPGRLGATLWHREEAWLSGDWDRGTDAGGYLCNYALFSALWRRPEVPAGFIHIPPPEVLAVEAQVEALAPLVQLLLEPCPTA